jgi:mono/diheme cytochrome c family protein
MAGAFALLIALPFCVPGMQAGGTKSQGESLFKANCILCHGEDGTGNTPAGTALGAHNLTSTEVVRKTDAELVQTISHGKEKMPSFGKKLSDAEIQALVSYIREIEKKR